MTALETILLAITGNAIALAVLGWLAKSFVESLLSKDIATYQDKLDRENQESIKELEHQLHLVAHEHNVRFSKLHEKRAEVISSVYALLNEAFERGQTYTSPSGYSSDPPKNEQFTSFAESFNALAKYYYPHRIYLPKETCERLTQLIQNMRGTVAGMNTYMCMADQSGGQLEMERSSAWDSAWKRFKNELLPASSELEEEFRTLLGSR